MAKLNLLKISLVKKRSLIFIGIFALSLGFRVAIPPYAIFNSPHDDELFVNLAYQIINGNWLGNFTNTTLLKTPGYPIWITFSNVLNIPVLVFTHFVGLIIFTFTSSQLSKLLDSKKLFLLIFSFLSLNPIIFSKNASRIYREVLISILIIFIIGIFIKLYLNIKTNKFKFKEKILTSILGLVIGFLYIVKIDTIFWAIVPIFLVFLFSVIKKVKLKQLTFIVLTLLVFSIIIPTLISLKNEKIYGLRVTNLISEGQLPNLINKLSSIDSGQTNHKYVSVSGQQRELAYNVSPSFRKLKENLELPEGIGWRFQSCMKLNICSESSTWFPYDINDAIFAAAGNDSFKIESFVSDILSELKIACQTNKIVCHNNKYLAWANLGEIDLKSSVDQISEIIKRSLFFYLDENYHRISLNSETTVEQNQIDIWAKTIINLKILDNQEMYNIDKVWLGSSISLLDVLFQIFIILGIFIFIISLFYKSIFFSSKFFVGLIFLILWLVHIVVLGFYDANVGPISEFVQPYLIESFSLLIIALVLFFDNFFNQINFFSKESNNR